MVAMMIASQTEPERAPQAGAMPMRLVSREGI